jgi:hypothetical protein
MPNSIEIHCADRADRLHSLPSSSLASPNHRGLESPSSPVACLCRVACLDHQALESPSSPRPFPRSAYHQLPIARLPRITKFSNHRVRLQDIPRYMPAPRSRCRPCRSRIRCLSRASGGPGPVRLCCSHFVCHHHTVLVGRDHCCSVLGSAPIALGSTE